MSGNLAIKLLELRNQVNISYQLIFNKEIIVQNEKIVYIDDNCLNQNSFFKNIGTLALLIDDFDKNILKSCLKGGYDDKLTNIDLLERLFEELKLEGNICDNFRRIKRLRNISFPFHNAPTREFVKALKIIGVNPPFDWGKIWTQCTDIYSTSLTEFSNQLELFYLKKSCEKRVEAETPKGYEREEQVVYLNDILYKYRLLVPLDFKYKMDFLVDYLTAAVTAYDRKLKSIDYALKKYVIPFKKKFTEHTEDWYFVKHRSFLNNEMFSNYDILLQREELQIRDDKEFLLYFRYVYAGVVAYQMGVTPDWLLKHYWGPQWLYKGIRDTE